MTQASLFDTDEPSEASVSPVEARNVTKPPCNPADAVAPATAPLSESDQRSYAGLSDYLAWRR